MKYRHSGRFRTHYVEGRRRGGEALTGSAAPALRVLELRGPPPRGALEPGLGQSQAGCLTGAVHLSKGNAGVPRMAQRGRKPRVEQKGKSHLDPDFQYEYGPRKRGLSILFGLRSLKQEVSEKLPQG